MEQTELAREMGVAAAKVSPPASIVIAHGFGLSLSDAMYLATTLYVALQGAYLIWKWRREARQK